MRAIKKVVKIKTVVVYYYDRVKKEEFTMTVTQSEFDTDIELPENAVLIETGVVYEEEVTLVLSAKDFVKYATIQE